MRERARQIGGDLARSGVVTLYSDAWRDGIRGEVLDLWLGDAQPPAVFGLSDLRAWHRGDLATAIDWLRS